MAKKMEKMEAPKANEAVVEALTSILVHIPNVSATKTFGMPSFRVGKKVFVSVAGDAVVVKLPLERTAQLIAEGRAVQFQPFGGPAMKGWVSLTHPDPGGFRADVDLFDESIAYVASQA